jgi:hypothetical protein
MITVCKTHVLLRTPKKGKPYIICFSLSDDKNYAIWPSFANNDLLMRYLENNEIE